MTRGIETITHAETTTDAPPTLPSHITPIGEQRRFSPYWWIGCARAAPEELRSLQGIVIYNTSECFFLAEDEAIHAASIILSLLARPRRKQESRVLKPEQRT
ncbi:MAG: hypothetical protein ACRDIV_17625 [Ktedonobacteraceae bacterium]